MKYRKVLIIMLFPFAASIIDGCSECTESFQFEYSNCSLLVDNLDNSGQKPVVSTTNTVPKQAFGLRVNVERMEGVCYNYFEPIFISSANAFSCNCKEEYESIPLDSIKSIKIITLMDFDSNHQSNADISAYFSVLQSTEHAPIDEYINSQQHLVADFQNLKLDLMLMVPPAQSSAFQFEVRIELSDGRTLTKTSEPIQLL